MRVIHKFLKDGQTFQRPYSIVVHAMAQYIQFPTEVLSAYDTLKKLGLSAHALVQPDGTIIRCRSDAQGAYHAKRHNANSLGIEFLVEGTYTLATFRRAITMEYVTPAQYKAGVEQVRAWVEFFGIDVIQRHSTLDPERKTDPGLGFPWKKFFDEVT